jgi:hypothetical protein
MHGIGFADVWVECLQTVLASAPATALHHRQAAAFLDLLHLKHNTCILQAQERTSLSMFTWY